MVNKTVRAVRRCVQHQQGPPPDTADLAGVWPERPDEAACTNEVLPPGDQGRADVYLIGCLSGDVDDLLCPNARCPAQRWNAAFICTRPAGHMGEHQWTPTEDVMLRTTPTMDD